MLDVRIGDSAPLRAEIMDNPLLWGSGYRGLAEPGEDECLLFVFDREDRHVFNMVGVEFPLDILWFDANRRCVGGCAMLPNSRVLYRPTEPCLYAVELHHGWIRAFGKSHTTLVGAELSWRDWGKK